MKKLLILLMHIVCVLNAGQLHITQKNCTNSFLSCKKSQHLSDVIGLTDEPSEQEFVCCAQRMYDLGVAHAWAGEYEQAFDCYQQAAFDATCSIAQEVAYNNMGAICADHGDYLRALACYIRAGKTGVVYYNIGLAHYMLENDQQAIDYLLQAKKELPNRSVLTCLAACYYRTGDYREAFRCLLNLYATYQDPEDAHQMGLIAWQENRLKIARHWFSKAAAAGHQEACKYLAQHAKA